MDSFPNQKTNNPGESSKFPKHYYWKDFIGGISGRKGSACWMASSICVCFLLYLFAMVLLLIPNKQKLVEHISASLQVIISYF